MHAERMRCFSEVTGECGTLLSIDLNNAVKSVDKEYFEVIARKSQKSLIPSKISSISYFCFDNTSQEFFA